MIFFVDLFLIYSNNVYFSWAMMRRTLAISFEKIRSSVFLKKKNFSLIGLVNLRFLIEIYDNCALCAA